MMKKNITLCGIGVILLAAEGKRIEAEVDSQTGRMRSVQRRSHDENDDD